MMERLLSQTTFYFVPFFNVDGFKAISEYYASDKFLLMIRKNRNDGSKDGSEACTDNENMGVDLNRNYDIAFGMNSIGSSSRPCDEDYRGPKAFSEPET